MLSRTPRVVTSSLRRTGLSSTTRSRAVAFQAQSKQPLLLGASLKQQQQFRRSFHTTSAVRKGITPESSDPAPPNPQSSHTAGGAVYVSEPSPLTDTEYYEFSEHYFNVLLGELERVQEEGSDLEAEYSAGVLNVVSPAIGTFVLNKQPPNKQIWLSSPISGPKRFDWVIQGDMAHEKQDTRGFLNGQWIYLRDGSNLTDLLNEELTISLPTDVYSEPQE